MKRTRLMLVARVIALPFIGYVIHKHTPSTGESMCRPSDRIYYILSFIELTRYVLEVTYIIKYIPWDRVTTKLKLNYSYNVNEFVYGILIV